MALGRLKTPPFRPQKELITSWNTWRKGLNLYLRESEVDGAEMTLATNLLLTGAGVPTKRWGSANYFIADSSLNGRGVFPIKAVNGTIDVLATTDAGYMVKKSNASYTVITGASWASGYNMEATQLGGNVYFVNGQRELVRYDFTSLVGFATLTSPTGLSLTAISNASGLTQWSWRVTAMSQVGETIASTALSRVSLPQVLAGNWFRLQWTPVSAASGILKGYSIYRGSPGGEAFIGGVDATNTTFDDFGSLPPDPTKTAPLADTTGGPIAKYILRYQDRLILAGIAGNPSKVLISGRYPYHERFDWYIGGGYILIEPDAGQDITGLGIHQEKLVVFKENSVWQVTLGSFDTAVGTILDPQYKLLTASQGCSSHRSIVPMENDLAFSNRKGMYILRYEPQLLNVINANEISAKVKPFFESLTDADLTTATGEYIDKKYVLSFPNSKKTIIFDRERLCFMGPWITPFGINKWSKYVDSSGVEKWIAIDADDSYVSEFRKTLVDDKGTAFRTVFKSKKEDFNDWTLFKTINEIYMLFRNVIGSVSVNIYLEERDGASVTAKAFTLTSSVGSSGFGTDGFGLSQFGVSTNNASFTSNELPKKSFIYKTARTFQIEVQTTGKQDNYELLGIKTIAIPQSRGNSPSSWNT